MKPRWPRPIVMYLPACPGNDPDVAGADVNCPGAAALCEATAIPDDLMFFRFRALQQRDGTHTPWQTAGQVCLRRADVPRQGRPEFTLTDFRRLPLPPARAHIQSGTPLDERTVEIRLDRLRDRPSGQ